MENPSFNCYPWCETFSLTHGTFMDDLLARGDSVSNLDVLHDSFGDVYNLPSKKRLKDKEIYLRDQFYRGSYDQQFSSSGDLGKFDAC